MCYGNHGSVITAFHKVYQSPIIHFSNLIEEAKYSQFDYIYLIEQGAETGHRSAIYFSNFFQGRSAFSNVNSFV